LPGEYRNTEGLEAYLFADVCDVNIEKQ